MKWYFACNDKSERYNYLIKAAVESALKNTDLDPHFIYDGQENELTDWLKSKGVNIIYHRSDFYNELASFYKDAAFNVATGAYLRCDIPIIETEDDYVLYTDCDVIFLKNPCFKNIEMPEYFSCASEIDKDDWSFFNSGVMLMNVKNLKNDYNEFKEFIVKNIHLMHTYDQTAYNLFYKNKFSKLPLELNWKPYWEISSSAQIIHFHGPKPHHYSTEFINNWPPIYKVIFSINPESCFYYISEFRKYFENIEYDMQGLINLTIKTVKETTIEETKPKFIKIIEKYKRSILKRIKK